MSGRCFLLALTLNDELIRYASTKLPYTDTPKHHFETRGPLLEAQLNTRVGSAPCPKQYTDDSCTWWVQGFTGLPGGGSVL